MHLNESGIADGQSATATDGQDLDDHRSTGDTEVESSPAMASN